MGLAIFNPDSSNPFPMWTYTIHKAPCNLAVRADDDERKHGAQRGYVRREAEACALRPSNQAKDRLSGKDPQH